MPETTVETINSKVTSSVYYLVHHRSGLDLLLMPMEGFVQTKAMFGAKYGSVDRCFKTSEDEDFITVPAGIAHYLEHKLFESEDIPVFEQYAKTGVSGNAATGPDSTVYYFTGSENCMEALGILLDFVQKPYFTKENVDKERGIIEQEISMTKDLPSRRNLENLLNALYANNEIKTDIAGTAESIAEITPELLYKCYNAFYNLHNMALSVAGSFDVDEVIRLCDEKLVPCADAELVTRRPYEPDEAVKTLVVDEFGVGVPMFNIGYKCRAFEGAELIERYAEADILLSLIVGTTSPLHKELTDEGLITSPLDRWVLAGNGFFTIIISGESPRPEEVFDRVKKYIAALGNVGVDKEMFTLLKKAAYGERVMLRDPEECAEEMLDMYFYGSKAFAMEERLAELTADDVQNALGELFREKSSALSVIK